MGTDYNIAFLELFRDHLNDIRELCGVSWLDFIQQVRPLLYQLATEQHSDELDRLVAEITVRSLATPAGPFIHELIEDHQKTRRETTRGESTRFEEPHVSERARTATAGVAGDLIEWLDSSDEYPYRKVKVFFATDRRPTGSHDPNKTFSGERGQLQYGTAHISIPDRHEAGRIERPWTFFPKSTERHVSVLAVARSGPRNFLDDLDEALRGAVERKLLIFVHGYRVSFAEAARVLAQLIFDLNFSGIPVLYSWPSRGSFFGYTRDEASAMRTRENFIAAMHTLAALQVSSEQHLLAHSMGNRVVFQGAQFLDEMRFRQIILAAPDEDAVTLESQMPRFFGRAERNTLYSSTKDLALTASRWIHGADRGGLVRTAGLDSIDASAINFSQFGHSYFHDQRSLLSDIYLILEHGLPPSKRPLIRRAPDGATWLFQP